MSDVGWWLVLQLGVRTPVAVAERNAHTDVPAFCYNSEVLPQVLSDWSSPSPSSEMGLRTSYVLNLTYVMILDGM